VFGVPQARKAPQARELCEPTEKKMGFSGHGWPIPLKKSEPSLCPDVLVNRAALVAAAWVAAAWVDAWVERRGVGGGSVGDGGVGGGGEGGGGEGGAVWLARAITE
jgi:hypothetical protein